MKYIDHKYDQLRAPGESFFVNKRGLHVFHRQGRVLFDDLLDRITGLFETPDGRCRNTRTRNYCGISNDMFVTLNVAELAVVSFLQLSYARLNVIDHIDHGHHRKLTVPHAFNLTGFGTAKIHLALEHVELYFRPMAITASDQLLRDLAKLLKRYPIVLHEYGYGPEANNVLEGVDTTVRRMAIFIRVARRKKTSSIPRLKLPLGQPSQAFDVVLAKGRYEGIPAHGHCRKVCLSRVVGKRHFGRITAHHIRLSETLRSKGRLRLLLSERASGSRSNLIG